MKLLLALAVVLLLRAAFLNQAIQGDDVYYLAFAEHAQIDPVHPINFRYVFQGELVDMEGHSHPPLNAWILGALLALVGDIREVPFHAGYIVFSLIAVASMWSLARRFSPHPLWATLLFIATPAFVINGSSLESDIPFLAFWMAGVALFVAGRYAVAAIALALASMAAYQAIFLTPILAVYVWLFARRSKAAWAMVLIPPVVIAGWQLFELATIGKLPIAVLSSHFQTYGFQSLVNKLRNAAALPMHACWMVFPALLPPAFLLSRKRRDPETIFLAAWIAIFLAGGVGIFFAGSARYLLPMAAPVALLVSRLNTRWLAAGFAAQMILSVSLAVVNYQHWDGYRAFAASLKPQIQNKRLWINDEWGYYFQAEGGVLLQKEQAVRAGDVVVTSELGYPVHFTTGGGALTKIAETEIRPALPLRLIALETRSAYSTIDRGYLPFDISTGPIDRVRAEIVVERRAHALLPADECARGRAAVGKRSLSARSESIPMDFGASCHSAEAPCGARASTGCVHDSRHVAGPSDLCAARRQGSRRADLRQARRLYHRDTGAASGRSNGDADDYRGQDVLRSRRPSRIGNRARRRGICSLRG